MALVTGTVVVDTDAGTWSAASGSVAEMLMTGEVAMLDAVPTVFPDFPEIPTETRADALQMLATKVNAQAPLWAALITSSTDVRVPADSFGTGVPASPVVLSGALE